MSSEVKLVASVPQMHTVRGAAGKTALRIGTLGLMPLSLPVHLCRKKLCEHGGCAVRDLWAVWEELHQDGEKREGEDPSLVSELSAPSCCPNANQGPHSTFLCWGLRGGILTIAVCPDQVGHQPVPGPCDGAAGQRVEWKGLSHSEDQVTLTQEIPPRATPCLSGSEGSFQKL